MLPLYITSKIEQQRKASERFIMFWWEQILPFVRLKLPLFWKINSSNLPEIVWGDFSHWKSANTILCDVLEGENKGIASSLTENLSLFAWKATKKKNIIFVQLWSDI